MDYMVVKSAADMEHVGNVSDAKPTSATGVADGEYQ